MKFSKTARYIKLKVYRHRRMLVLGSVAVVLALILMAKHENNVRFVGSDMANARTRDVWEYVSDFSNMMKLNPTIQWNYTVEYEEHLSQLPFVTNKIVGDFIIDESQPQRSIKSSHRTCFFRIYCYLPNILRETANVPQHDDGKIITELYTTSEMVFLDLSNGTTRIVENIKYECPWMLTKFCMNEVMYQRREIFGQLRTVFAHTKH